MILQELDYQNTNPIKGKKKDKEGIVHDLIFKRRSKNTDPLNDLWILSEEYVHFDGCSELALNKITDSSGQNLLRHISDEELEKHGVKTDRRPDIFLFASERKCVLIELKAPDVDLSSHLQQMIRLRHKRPYLYLYCGWHCWGNSRSFLERPPAQIALAIIYDCHRLFLRRFADYANNRADSFIFYRVSGCFCSPVR
ncbi:MAG: hypothetical protein AABY33_02345 [Pseudomonadota bacterium]